MPIAVILKVFIRIFTCVLFSFFANALLWAQGKPAYELFAANGKPIKYKDALAKMQQADIVLFGEQHNDPIAHWLEYEFAADLIRAKGRTGVVVGMEMLETHQQAATNEYLSQKISAKAFRAQEGMWDNYATDYAPVVDFCRDSSVAVIATNVPRKYASLTAKRGLLALDSLPAAEKQLFAALPLTVPYDLPSYQQMREMMGGHGHGSGMNADNFIAAQALKDATMAANILQHWKKGTVFYHLNGAFHSDKHEGIAWYLQKANPALKIVVISTVSQADLRKLDKENKELGDVLLVVPETMTKTY